MSEKNPAARALYLTEEEAMGLLDLCLAGSFPLDCAKDRAIVKLSEVIRGFIIDDEINRRLDRRDGRNNPATDELLLDNPAAQSQEITDDASRRQPSSGPIDYRGDYFDLLADYSRPDHDDTDGAGPESRSAKSRFRRTMPETGGSSVPIVRRRRLY